LLVSHDLRLLGRLTRIRWDISPKPGGTDGPMLLTLH